MESYLTLDFLQTSTCYLIYLFICLKCIPYILMGQDLRIWKLSTGHDSKCVT